MIKGPVEKVPLRTHFGSYLCYRAFGSVHVLRPCAATEVTLLKKASRCVALLVQESLFGSYAQARIPYPKQASCKAKQVFEGY